MLNSQLVGKTYPPLETYLVGREKVREFAIAVGDNNPCSHELSAAHQAGYRDLVAPVTFGFSLVMRSLATAMFDPALGLQYERVVHGEQSFRYSAPIVAGDEIEIHARIAHIDSAGKHEFLTVATDLVTTAGDVLIAAESVLVSRETGAQA